MKTETDRYDDHGASARATAQVLYLAFHGHEPRRLPSRHVVDEIDAVEIGRGSDAIERAGRRLVVRVADPLMSSEHCLLRHARGEWVIEDRGSRNGTFLDGQRVERSALASDQLFTVGHTAWFVTRDDADPAGPADLAGSQLPIYGGGLTTFSAAYARSLDVMARIATDPQLAVIVLGESGTGKELVARAIHALSKRTGKFVAVNCGGIARELVESELFGHRRGAFTGALADQLGAVRASDKGTLFLDEIAELSEHAQATLLRVIQEREVVPVGQPLPVPVDLRVIAATHRDMPDFVTKERFRSDLWYRINGATIRLPALRERRADLSLLIAALLERHAPKRALRFTPQATTRLFQHGWPGNVRELENTLLLVLALAERDLVAAEHLPDGIVAPAPRAPRARPRILLSEEELELKRALESELREHTLSEVARRRGKDRKQIYRIIARLKIDLAELKLRDE